MEEANPSPSGDARAAPIRLVAVLLLLIALGCVVAGGRSILWPLGTWPMYSGLTFHFPPKHFAVHELVVVCDAGESHRIRLDELLAHGQDSAVDRVIASAFTEEWEITDRPAYFRCLWDMACRARPGVEAERVEVWRLSWEVDAMARVPFRPDDSPTRTLVGSIQPDDPGGES